MRCRRGDEMADLPHESMRLALGKTLGVPLFQEQMMQLAIDCAFFTPTEADRLRQAMSSKRAPERIEELRERLLEGMAANGIPADVAEDIYVKILAFSSYGFPESHAISFAYLVYASAWLKCYYPAAFTAALLRAQPMGFYSPASLISDVRRHGVEVRGVDVNVSAVLAALENPAGGGAARGAGQDDPARGKPPAGHPALRAALAEQGVIGASDLRTARPGSNVTVAGLVTHRQQPGTARGVVFLSLEDETGMANVICPPAVWERHRRLALDASALVVFGRVERLDGAASLLAARLRRLRVVAAARSRDFR